MIRKFVTFKGEVLEETDWEPRPTDECFYCEIPLEWIMVENSQFSICWDSQDNNHDWITLVNPSEFRR